MLTKSCTPSLAYFSESNYICIRTTFTLQHLSSMETSDNLYSKLEQLYSSIENLENLGLELKETLQAEILKCEENIIKKEILPAISQDLTSKLSVIRRNLVLVVEYTPGEPVKVALSRKTRISDIADAKTLTPSLSKATTQRQLPQQQSISNSVKEASSNAAASNEDASSAPKPLPSLKYRERKAPKERARITDRRVQHPTRGFRVSFPGGPTFAGNTAIETYIAVLKYIGFEKVARLNLYLSRYNIVSREERPDPTPGKNKWQHKVEGWYIYTHSSNETKKGVLRRISEALRLQLIIEDL